MREALPLLMFLVLQGSAATAASEITRDAPRGFVPEQCLEIETEDRRPGLAAQTPAADADWNDAYRRGLQALEREDFHGAELEMCRALIAAREFEPRDWRFAETLDELGLIAFSLRDYEFAEQVQGAAIAEMLLAVGPHGEPFRDAAASDQAPIRKDCRSGVRVYTTRLGWIHDQVPARIEKAELDQAPWRIFAAGYLPLDEQLAERLEWLVSRYLLEENLTAAEELGELQRRILEAP